MFRICPYSGNDFLFTVPPSGTPWILASKWRTWRTYQRSPLSWHILHTVHTPVCNTNLNAHFSLCTCTPWLHQSSTLTCTPCFRAAHPISSPEIPLCFPQQFLWLTHWAANRKVGSMTGHSSMRCLCVILWPDLWTRCNKTQICTQCLLTKFAWQKCVEYPGKHWSNKRYWSIVFQFQGFTPRFT